MPAVLSKPVAGIADDEEIVVLRPKVGTMSAVPFRPLKRARADSNPPSEHSRTVSGSDVGAPTPSEADTTSLADNGSDVDSVAMIPRRNKTKHKRLKADPEAELAACIIRIKASKSQAYETFKDPVIDYKVSPPTHYVFECKTCGKHVPRRIGVSETSGLLNHANRCVARAKQTDLLDGYGITGHSATLTQEDVCEFFALWVCENAQPFTIVEDRYLRKLLDPQVRKYAPHRTTISAGIKRIYKATQDEIITKLATIPGIFHIALDMVQTDNGQDYLGIVLFHLGKPENESIGIERFLLECLSFGGEAHTGEALACAVYDVLCKFKIQDCVWGVVCDNASNNAKMVDHLAQYGLKRLTGPESRVYCLLHVLNLTAQAIMCEFRKARPTATNNNQEDEDTYDMPSLEKLEPSDGEDDDDDNAPSWMLGGDEEDPFVIVELPKVKPGSPEAQEITQVGQVLYKLAKFAHKLRYSPKARETFKRACAEKEVETPHSVHRDLKTRWNSTGDMSHDGDRTFPAILLTQQEPSLGIPRAHHLQKDDQKHLKNLITLLEPLKVLTEILSRSSVPMLADVIAHFDALDSVYTSMAADEKLPLYVQQAAERARIVLNKYYQMTDLSWLYRIAIILHPSMRAYYLKQAEWPEDWIEGVFEIAEEVFDRFYKPTGNSSAQASASGPSQFGYTSYMSRMYSSVGGPSPSESVSPIREFANGAPLVDLAEDGEPRLRNPLLWWHNQRVAGNEWNGLTQMALDVLSMPATSVDVERAFSFVGSFVSKRRHNLGAFTIQAVASLGSYSKAGLVKRGCLSLPRKAKAKAKAQPEGRSTD